MFRIGICLGTTQMTGLEALDWARSRGLADTTTLYFSRSAVEVEVSEAFARQYFGPDQVTVDRSVEDKSLLAKGDLENRHNDQWAGLVRDLSHERIRDLWVASNPASNPDKGKD